MPFSHHSHSGQFSYHAKNTLEEMVQSAINRGMQTFVLTEHMPRDIGSDAYPEEVGLLPFPLGLSSPPQRLSLASLPSISTTCSDSIMSRRSDYKGHIRRQFEYWLDSNANGFGLLSSTLSKSCLKDINSKHLWDRSITFMGSPSTLIAISTIRLELHVVVQKRRSLQNISMHS